MKSWPHVLWRRTRPGNVEARSQPATTGASSWLTAASCVGLSLAGRLEKAQITTVPQYAPGPLERREHRSREGRAGHCLFPGGATGRGVAVMEGVDCSMRPVAVMTRTRVHKMYSLCAHRPRWALRHSSGAADSASSGPQSTTRPPWRPCHPVTTLFPLPLPSPPLLPWHAAHQIRLLLSLGRAGWPWQTNRRRARVSAGDETPFEGPTTPMPHMTHMPLSAGPSEQRSPCPKRLDMGVLAGYYFYIRTYFYYMSINCINLVWSGRKVADGGRPPSLPLHRDAGIAQDTRM